MYPKYLNGIIGGGSNPMPPTTQCGGFENERIKSQGRDHLILSPEQLQLVTTVVPFNHCAYWIITRAEPSHTV